MTNIIYAKHIFEQHARFDFSRISAQDERIWEAVIYETLSHSDLGMFQKIKLKLKRPRLDTLDEFLMNPGLQDENYPGSFAKWKKPLFSMGTYVEEVEV